MSIVTSSLNLPGKTDKTNENPLKEYTHALSIAWDVSEIAYKVYQKLFLLSTNLQGLSMGRGVNIKMKLSKMIKNKNTTKK
jgi:hypothetical protein